MKQWNKDYFGNVEQKIHQKEDSILALQIDMDSNPLDENYTLLKDAKSTLHNLLQAEETCWKQKSRVKWLDEGNHNTRFFHLSAKIRGKSNTIDNISYNGKNLVDHHDIK